MRPDHAGPGISSVWPGGPRIKVTRLAPWPGDGDAWPRRRPEPGYVLFRVFAGGLMPHRAARLAGSLTHGGPRIDLTVRVVDAGDGPDIAGCQAAICRLHRRWPKLPFYDCTGLDLRRLFAPSAQEQDGMPEEDLSWLQGARS